MVMFSILLNGKRGLVFFNRDFVRTLCGWRQRYKYRL